MALLKNKKFLGGIAVAVSLVAGVSVKTLLFSSDEVSFASGAELTAYYDSLGYTLDGVVAGEAIVPRLLLEKVPSKWRGIQGADARKDVFFRTMLPLVLEANGKVTRDRARLLQLQSRAEKGQPIDGDDLVWLRGLAEKYEVEDWQGIDESNQLDRLVRRVDVVPVSLALIQAAVESAYGRSRFAREGNALFGQWAWGKGMEPADQRDGKGDYRVAAFKSPLASVEAYLLNLNTHPAYQDFRVRRAAIRAQGDDVLRGLDLVGGLSAYSEKGEAYLEILSKAIRANGLGRFDGASMAAEEAVKLVPNLRR